VKVVFVNRFFHPDLSATSQLATDLALHVASRHEVHVVTSRLLHDDPRAALDAAATHDGVTVHRVRTSRFGRAALPGRAVDYATFYLAARAALARTAGRRDVIVAMTDPPLVSVVAASAARRSGARLVNWLQEVFPEVAQRLGVLRGPVGSAAKRSRDASLRDAAMNVVVGERMREVVSALGVPGERIRAIPNWADGRLVRPVERAANRLRADWDLGERFVVGYSGNMGRAHEFATLLDAAVRLRDDPSILFLFVGDGRQREWIEGEAGRRGLANIRFRPLQPRAALAESLSAPDVHVVTLQPALEGLVVPSKFYGVAAAGRPTLFVGDLDGEIARELARAGSGLAFAPGDAQGLAGAIAKLRDASEARLAMGRAARAHFEAHHDRAHAFAQWDRLLDDVGRE
jgi:colanic acid biosynthesis glycosyl transferase WcaI